MQTQRMNVPVNPDPGIGGFVVRGYSHLLEAGEMNTSLLKKLALVALLSLSTVVHGAPWFVTNPEQTVIDWQGFRRGDVQLRAAKAARGTNGWLQVRTERTFGRVGVKVNLPMQARGLENYAEIAVPVRNTGSNDLPIILRVDDPSTEILPTTKTRRCIHQACIPPGSEPAWLVVPLAELGDTQARRYSKEDASTPAEGKFISMVGQPVDFVRRGAVSGAELCAVSVFTPDPDVEHSFEIGPVIARGTPAPFADWPESKIFPIVDEFGQYAHRNWANKIHAVKDFDLRKQAEETTFARNSRPGQWDRFGGWATGPKLEATGFFRVQEVDGAWWIVDPDGRLFWSHGVVRVGTRIRVGSEYHGTPLPDRERYFRLPQRNSALGAFYGTEPQSTRRYYVGRDNHAVYDFLEANLFRKYGSDWRSVYAVEAQRRLACWALNTIANSSDPTIFLKRQTPYTAIVYSAPLGRSEFRLRGSAGNWGKLPDPFDPGWRQLISRTLQTELKDSLKDPWCLGFFVDNELNWGDTNYLGGCTLASPKEQPAKQAMASALKRKYSDIGQLNAAWGTALESWEAWLNLTNAPDKSKTAVVEDLAAFGEQYLDLYFRGCRDAIREAAPNHMYLGCRFAGSGNPAVLRVAAQYCEIISINRYTHSVADLRLSGGLNRPILIGEFHFTSMDAPMQPSGLVVVADHPDRARAYRTYVSSALRNPAVVGTHWFQFYDQPTTGRFDGENYQTGLLDICDTPYAETVNACREMGTRMYEIRGAATGLNPSNLR